MLHFIQGVATLIIPQVRYADSGEYYFNASYTSEPTGILYYATTNTQLNVIRQLKLI